MLMLFLLLKPPQIKHSYSKLPKIQLIKFLLKASPVALQDLLLYTLLDYIIKLQYAIGLLNL